MSDNIKPERIVIRTEDDLIQVALPRLLAYRPEAGGLIVSTTSGQPLVSITADTVAEFATLDLRDLAAELAVLTRQPIFGVVVVGDDDNVPQDQWEAGLTATVAALDSLSVEWVSRLYVGIEDAEILFAHLPTRDEWVRATPIEARRADNRRAEIEALRRLVGEEV